MPQASPFHKHSAFLVKSQGQPRRRPGGQGELGSSSHSCPARSSPGPPHEHASGKKSLRPEAWEARTAAEFLNEGSGPWAPPLPLVLFCISFMSILAPNLVCCTCLGFIITLVEWTYNTFSYLSSERGFTSVFESLCYILGHLHIQKVPFHLLKISFQKCESISFCFDLCEYGE